ncbi:MAG TPA: ATP-binding protein [Candidatus Xenobia bacterium]
MTHSRALAADAFHTLVRQFSHELCFYRELIQNAVDAGSRRVDIWLEHQDGAAVIHVRDYGEGMTAKIIEGQFTKLFASAKTGDLTKVGQFGIGFVSVFACQPETVTVDTGRHGESWRILFNKNGEFERVALSQPHDGTHVILHVRMRENKFAGFVARSRESVKYWCRFVPANINFQKEAMQEPFAADGLCPVHADAGGTEVVAALSSDGRTRFGFYKGGITLVEGDEVAKMPVLNQPWLEGVSFRINSKFLEHTLTRDTIKIDGDLHKALKLLRQTVQGALYTAMFTQLEAAAAGDPEAWDDVLRPCGPHLLRTLDAIQAAKVLPCLNGSPPLAPAALKAHQVQQARLLKTLGLPRAEKALLWGEEDHPVGELLAAQKVPAIRCQEGDAIHRFLSAQPFQLVRVDEALAAVEAVADSTADAAQRRLLGETVRVLKAAGLAIQSASLAHWEDHEELCIWPVGERPPTGSRRLVYRQFPPERPDHLFLLEGHPLVTRLSRLPLSAGSRLLARAVASASRLPVSTERLLEIR